jgi:hypothetical protein
MNREQILSVLYDLSLTIGGEVDLLSLLRRTLQRLLFHTSFPAALFWSIARIPNSAPRPVSRKRIGDYQCWRAPAAPVSAAGRPARRQGRVARRSGLLTAPFRSSATLSIACACRSTGANDPAAVACEPPTSDLPLTQVFQPVLANLAKAHRPLSQQRAADRAYWRRS